MFGRLYGEIEQKVNGELQIKMKKNISFILSGLAFLAFDFMFICVCLDSFMQIKDKILILVGRLCNCSIISLDFLYSFIGLVMVAVILILALLAVFLVGLISFYLFSSCKHKE